MVHSHCSQARDRTLELDMVDRQVPDCLVWNQVIVIVVLCVRLVVLCPPKQTTPKIKTHQSLNRLTGESCVQAFLNQEESVLKGAMGLSGKMADLPRLFYICGEIFESVMPPGPVND